MILGAVLGLGLGLMLWWQTVPTHVTAEDRVAIRQILAPTFEDEIALIRAVQKRVIEIGTIRAGIPKGQTREPADFIIAASDLCYDQSRTLEKILQAFGFETRHVAVYQSVMALLLPRVSSHALSEVLTSRGWLAVDNATPWIGLTVAGEPVSVAEAADADLAAPLPDLDVFEGEYITVIGLYSRHGQFYPPFTPFPDVNWRQFAGNLW